jgi:hypothetical protein
MTEKSNSVRRIFLLTLIALTLFYTAVDGLRSGWSGWLPGSMSRHRDAVAVAVTAVAYGKWQGYASYQAVNRVLREHGLSVQNEDLADVGAKHYFDVMIDAEQLNAALKAASSLQNPAAEGLYYSQDEKGMAAFYTASFAIFGLASSSWYWLYMVIFSLSILTAIIAFRRHQDILLFLLALVCVHSLVAHVLPMIPRQDINVVHGNRFLGIMASVAMFHLMFLISRRELPTPGQIIAAIIQTTIICLTIIARTSAVWLVIAIVLFWAGLWVMSLLRNKDNQSARSRTAVWPIAIIAIGLILLFAHQRFVPDSAFRDGRAYGGHVFWHNLVTALHNNPQRTDRFGIPPEYPAYDDQVAYFTFDREIALRGDDRSKYLVGDSNWIYRTSSQSLDFRWAAYDQVLQDVFLRTIFSNPGYAINSFMIQQPASILGIALGRNFLGSPSMLLMAIPVALFLGLIIFAARVRLDPALFAPALVAAIFGSMLPAFVAAAAELRSVEIFYTLLLSCTFAVAGLAALLMRTVFQKFSGGRRA